MSAPPQSPWSTTRRPQIEDKCGGDVDTVGNASVLCHIPGTNTLFKRRDVYISMETGSTKESGERRIRESEPNPALHITHRYREAGHWEYRAPPLWKQSGSLGKVLEGPFYHKHGIFLVSPVWTWVTHTLIPLLSFSPFKNPLNLSQTGSILIGETHIPTHRKRKEKLRWEFALNFAQPCCFCP